MAAYLMVRARVHDRPAFLSGYAPAAAALIERFGGKYLARTPAVEVLEGEDHGGSLVISEWPDRAAALAFWHSPDYAETRRLRARIADVEVVLIDGDAVAPTGR